LTHTVYELITTVTSSLCTIVVHVTASNNSSKLPFHSVADTGGSLGSAESPSAVHLLLKI